MKILNYSLIVVALLGICIEQHASYRIGAPKRSGQRAVVSPRGGNYNLASKYFDEQGNITPAGIKRIEDYEATLPENASSAAAAAEPQISSPSLPRPHVSFSRDVVTDKKFEGQYRGATSARGEKFGQNVSSSSMAKMNKKHEAAARESSHRYNTADLYIQDAELGEVVDVLEDLSRIWMDNFGVKYRLSASNFDESGNLTTVGRDTLQRAQQAKRLRLASRTAAASPVVEEPQDDDENSWTLTRLGSPEAVEVARVFVPDASQSAVATGSQRVVTRDFVAMLESMRNEQLIDILPKILVMPKPIEVLAAENLSISDLRTIFYGTIDLAGDITADFLEIFFKVRCDNIDTLTRYVAWLKQKLIPLMTDLFMERKHAVEQHYLDVRDQIVQEEQLREQDLAGRLVQADTAEQRTKIKGGVAMTYLTGLPVVVHYTPMFADQPIVRKVLYGSCLVAAVVKMTIIVGRLSDVQRTKYGLIRAKEQVGQNIMTLNALPKSMGQGSIDLFDQKLGSFVSEMNRRVAELQRAEWERINRELEAMQAAASAASVPAIEDRGASSAVPTSTAVAVQGSAAAPMTKKQIALKGLSLVFRGIGFVAGNISH